MITTFVYRKTLVNPLCAGEYVIIMKERKKRKKRRESQRKRKERKKILEKKRKKMKRKRRKKDTVRVELTYHTVGSHWVHGFTV